MLLFRCYVTCYINFEPTRFQWFWRGRLEDTFIATDSVWGQWIQRIINISSANLEMPLREKIDSGENDLKVNKRRIKSEIYFADQQMSCWHSPWNALEVCSSAADPMWEGLMFSWRLWHQSSGWGNLKVGRVEKQTNKHQFIDTSCLTSHWLITFHSALMTALLSVSALDGDTFKEQTWQATGVDLKEKQQSYSCFVLGPIKIAFSSLSLFQLLHHVDNRTHDRRR